MFFQVDMCCLCLRHSTDKLHYLNDIGVPPDVSYYEKINLTLSKLDFNHEYTEDYVLCVKCSTIIDNIYEFNNKSIRNIDIMTHYLMLLNSPGNKRCKLVVELSDCCDTVINNKDFIKLEDMITSKETDSMDHNTIRVCETMQDKGDIIFHRSDNAFVSSRLMVNEVKGVNSEININKLIADACVDIYINEELDIKIEEPEVVPNTLKHSYELSDCNAVIDNKECIKLEDKITSEETDSIVHNTAPVGETMQDNGDIILHRSDDAYVSTVDIINDVKLVNNEINTNKIFEDDIDIKEELNIKIEEPQVVADYLKHAYELSDLNNKLINKGDCVKLGDPNVMVHDGTSGSDSLQANDDIMLYQPDDDYVVTAGELDSDVEVEYSDDNVEGVSSESEEYADGSPGSVGDRNNIAAGASQHEPIRSEEKVSISDPANKGCNASSDVTAHILTAHILTVVDKEECDKKCHTNEGSCARIVCKKRLTRKEHLIKPKQIHTDESPFICEVCNKTLHNQSNFVKHKRIHTGEKPFVCEVCDKGFCDQSNLSRHKQKHSGDFPFVCEVCKKGFPSNAYLVIHKRIHTGEKPYVCEVCNKGFMTTGHLVVHKRLHTGEKPYECEVCNKRFAVTGTLIQHKRTHTGDKPFECEVCNKGFTTSGDLHKHKRIHTGNKPFVCEVCNIRFTWNTSLIVHKRKTHKRVALGV